MRQADEKYFALAIKLAPGHEDIYIDLVPNSSEDGSAGLLALVANEIEKCNQ